MPGASNDYACASGRRRRRPGSSCHQRTMWASPGHPRTAATCCAASRPEGVGRERQEEEARVQAGSAPGAGFKKKGGRGCEATGARERTKATGRRPRSSPKDDDEGELASPFCLRHHGKVIEVSNVAPALVVHRQGVCDARLLPGGPPECHQKHQKHQNTQNAVQDNQAGAQRASERACQEKERLIFDDNCTGPGGG